jgi:hypothetical protein
MGQAIGQVDMATMRTDSRGVGYRIIRHRQIPPNSQTIRRILKRNYAVIRRYLTCCPAITPLISTWPYVPTSRTAQLAQLAVEDGLACAPPGH